MHDAMGTGARRPELLERVALQALQRRFVRGGLKKYVRDYLRSAGSVCEIDLDGVRMRCHLGDNFTEQRLAEGRNDDDLANVHRIVDPLAPGGVFVDIGANCGLYSLFAARRVGAMGKVIAFEPIPEMQRRLAANAALNGFGQIQVVPVAVGAQESRISINVNAAQYGETSIGAAGGAGLEVRVRPLRDVLEEAGIGAVHALKIDIEGYEDQALLPFLETAPPGMLPNRILMEIAHKGRWQKDLMGALAKAGYRETWSSRTDVVLTRAG